MAEITTIARPYAEALARMAREGNSWQAWSDMLAVAAHVAAEPEIAALTDNPTVSAERMAEVIMALCGERLNADGITFVHLLAENKRCGALPEIARLFEEIRDELRGVVDARITTAYPLSEVQMSGLVAKLKTKFGLEIDASQETDSSLIGGVVIRVGDQVIDASVRGKLSAMAVAIKN